MPARIPSPTALGLPPKYEQWRQQQIDGITFVRHSPVRIRGLAASPGVGKTGCAWAIGLLARRDNKHSRTLILTETKALQAIYASEAEQMAPGMVANIMGAGNYTCDALLDGGRYEHMNRGGRATKVDQAPCLAGMPCRLRDRGCQYYGSTGALQRARDASIVITNYANWIVAAELADREEKFGEFDTIICDEGHAAMDALCRQLTVEIDLRDVNHHAEPLRADANADSTAWLAWAKRLQPKLQLELDDLQSEIKSVRATGMRTPVRMLDDLRRLQRLVRATERAATAKGEWVIERRASKVVFTPVWSDAYTESHLLRGIPNVVFMSGTLVPQDLIYMGIKRKEFDWLEMPSPFPLARRPVYILPCGQMRWDMTETTERDVITGMDSIIKSRAGWRYLVHTVSYDRALKVERLSTHADRMIVDHRRDVTAEIIEAFKADAGDDSLGVVSPAIATGHDFPDDQARFQVILKIPIADSRDVVTKARVAHSKKYLYYAAMRYIVQAVMRIVRSESDYGETWIVDSSWVIWFERAAKEFIPEWFRPAVKVVSGIGRRPKL
jgi:Rad3-related DNA helicase